MYFTSDANRANSLGCSLLRILCTGLKTLQMEFEDILELHMCHRPRFVCSATVCAHFPVFIANDPEPTVEVNVFVDCLWALEAGTICHVFSLQTACAHDIGLCHDTAINN